MYISVLMSVAAVYSFNAPPGSFFCSFFSSRVWLACDVVSSSPVSGRFSPPCFYFFFSDASVCRPSFCFCFGTIVPSVAWGEDGIDELHVVGRVYRELLVCTANFTYIYATSLSTLYSLCLLYTQIQHIKYLYKGVL